MTDNSALFEEMLRAILAEPNREIRAAMSRALHNAMNDPEPEKAIRGDTTIDKIVQKEMLAYLGALKGKTA